MDFLLSIPYIVLLLGGLIFFHELGHFLFARWNGVHVVTFSIGFGPTVMKIMDMTKRTMIMVNTTMSTASIRKATRTVLNSASSERLS